MAQPETTKILRVLLGSGAGPIEYAVPCGLNQQSLTLTKGLEEVSIPDCDDPYAVAWLGRDATSLSMSVEGEGVVAESSIDVWLDAQESADSVPVKVELVFAARTITWTGNMHVETAGIAKPSNTGRATLNISMQSDGEMVRTSTASS